MPVESAHFKIVTHLSKQCHTFCKGLLHTLRNGVLYAKSFYKCCLQTYFPFIIYREHIAWIGACFDCTFPKITIAYVEGNPCRDVVCTFLKQCCTLCKGLLRLFVVLFLKLLGQSGNLCRGHLLVPQTVCRWEVHDIHVILAGWINCLWHWFF